MRYSKIIGLVVLLVMILTACAPAQTPAPANTATPRSADETPIVSTIPALTDTPTVSTIPTLTPTPAQPITPAVLPAPLYFLAGTGTSSQVWRIETDGSTRTPITQEPTGVTDFDVSARDGSIAYISSNALIKTDGLGQNRSVLVQGPALAPERDESYYTTELTKPRWSPDGSRVAYGLNGINLIDTTSGLTSTLQPNDPIPGPNEPMTQTANLYWPYNWSPDGSRLLIEIGYYRSEGSLGVLNLADNSVSALSSPQGYVCCNPVWAADNRTIFYANPTDGMVPPGLWRTDVTTGEGETLINGIAKDATLSVGNVYPATTGTLHYFYAVTKAPNPQPGMPVPLAMYRSASDGVTDQTQLRADAYVIGEAVWAEDASGAVIVEVQGEPQYPPSGPLHYLPADGSPAVPLAAEGRLLRWGK